MDAVHPSRAIGAAKHKCIRATVTHGGVQADSDGRHANCVCGAPGRFHPRQVFIVPYRLQRDMQPFEGKPLSLHAMRRQQAFDLGIETCRVRRTWAQSKKSGLPGRQIQQVQALRIGRRREHIAKQIMLGHGLLQVTRITV